MLLCQVCKAPGRLSKDDRLLQACLPHALVRDRRHGTLPIQTLARFAARARQGVMHCVLAAQMLIAP